MTPAIGLRIAALSLCVAAGALAGCGGGGMVPSGSSSQRGAMASATLKIVVPEKTASGKRRPEYISPSTAQLAWSVNGNQQPAVALTTANPNCATGTSGLTCTVTFQLAPATYTLAFTLEDSSGAPLSGATNVNATLVAGDANTIAVTLGGIATSAVITPQSADGSRVTGSTANGFQLYGNSSLQFAITLQDADGNTILGAGAPQPSISPSPGAPLSIASPSSTSSNVWTIASTFSATAPAAASLTSIQIVATPYPNSGGSTLTANVSLALYQPWIYVLNSGNGTIAAFDEQGNAKSVSFSGMNGPLGMTIDNSTSASDPYSGTIYVSNASAPSIGLYQPSGTATSAPGSFAGLASPGPIAFDSHDLELYVANTAGSTTMQAFTAAGASASFSSTGAVSNPTALAYDSVDDLIFLTSYTTGSSATNTVASYNEAGVAQTSWSAGLSEPSGAAFDTNNDWLYVTNAGNNTVTAFNTTGTQETSFSVSALPSPGPILFDPYNHELYVANKSNLQAYSESGTSQGLSVSALSTPSAMVIVP
jgi:hypothetical protein